MKKLLVAVTVLAVSWSPVAAAASGRIVYMGLDPADATHHSRFPQTTLLGQNAVTWVGKSADPAIGYAKTLWRWTAASGPGLWPSARR